MPNMHHQMPQLHTSAVMVRDAPVPNTCPGDALRLVGPAESFKVPQLLLLLFDRRATQGYTLCVVPWLSSDRWAGS